MYKNKEQSLETFTMSAENPEFHKRLEVLEETINLILDNDLQKWSYKTSQEGYFSRCKISYGKKFVKIVKEEGTNPDYPREVSQFGWVDMFCCRTVDCHCCIWYSFAYICWCIVLQKRLVGDCKTIGTRTQRGDYSRVSSVQLEY